MAYALNSTDAPAGIRALVESPNAAKTKIVEVRILEWSPSEQHVKLGYLSGSSEWLEVEAAPLFVESLGVLPATDSRRGLGSYPTSIPLEHAFPGVKDSQ